MVFIWMVQHAHAPIGCFYFIFISLKYNIVAPDYNKNTFVASVIGLRLYLPLYGRLKLRSNRWLLLRRLPPFWWTADSNFLKSRAYDFEQSWRWLANVWAHTPNLLPYLGNAWPACFSANHHTAQPHCKEYSCSFRKFSFSIMLAVRAVFRSQALRYGFIHYIYSEHSFLCHKFAREL